MPAAPLEPHSYVVPGDGLRTGTTPLLRYLAGLCVLLEHGHLFELPEHPKRAAADRFAASLATLRDWLTAEERADVADFEAAAEAIRLAFRKAANLGVSPSEDEDRIRTVRDLVRRNFDDSGILADCVPVSRIVDLLHAASARGDLTFADHEVRGLVLRALPAVECSGFDFLGLRPVP